MNYIPLKVKTNYSILTSLIKIDELIDKCKKLNINTIAICDDNMYGVMEFYKECKKNNIKPIIGLEINIDNNSILLYAKNYEGYQNLCYISSNEKNIDILKENNNNLICILPYESLSMYDKLNNIYNDLYVSYNSKEERDNIIDKKCIFINTIRCLEKTDISYLKYVYLIKDGKKISDEKIYEFDSNSYLMDSEESLKYINKMDLINYKIIEEMCNIEIKSRNDLFPKYNNDPSFNEYEYLSKLCKKGLLKRCNEKVPIMYANRLMYELDIINKMGFCNYFLIVWDFVKYAKQNKILVGPGRGSAIGSLVSYSLGITDIDPIKYDLFFERFLNPERVTMPDIDIDFDSKRKGEVIKYVEEKYGYKNVSQIIAFSTLKSRAILRDLIRVFDLENVKTDNFIKLIDSDLSLLENKRNILVKNELDSDILLSKIYDIAIKLENLKRQTTIHAAGIIISNKELDRYIPIKKINENEYVSCFDKDYLEELGLLKMDFLSLDNLTLINELLNEIKEVEFSKIPLNDEKTLELFKKIETDGIFQFESSGMKNLLRKMNVTSFDDLIAAIALFRPGAMDSIDLYIKRKNKKEKINYINDKLKDILESTYGVIVYQEQVMQIANVMAGYSLGEADILRRAMSKKSKEIMTLEKEKFISRSINNGYTKEESNEVYDLIYKFADFGFNKSHSVGYALIAYKMAYLKSHYPNYFLSHLLTMNLGSENKTKQYINEAKNNNINILMPSINESEYKYTVKGNDIIFSLASVNYVGSITSKEIIKIREDGKFKNFFDFVSRCFQKVTRKQIEYLIYAGCFDEFNYNHKTLINTIDIAINYAMLVKDLDSSLVKEPEIQIEEEFDKNELIKQEYEAFGFYLSYHPVQNYRKNNINTTKIKDYFNNRIEIYLLIDNVKVIKTKDNEKMAFILASDEYGEIDMVMFPKTFNRYFDLSKGEIVFIKAKVERRVNKYQLVIYDMKRFI